VQKNFTSVQTKVQCDNFVCAGKVADENNHTDPVITIKMLRQLAAFDPLATMERAWEPVIKILTTGLRGSFMFTGRGELQKMAVVFPDTRG
jgi:hypothetical protein